MTARTVFGLNCCFCFWFVFSVFSFCCISLDTSLAIIQTTCNRVPFLNYSFIMIHRYKQAHLETRLEAHLGAHKCQAPSSINQILSMTHRCCRSSPLNGLTMRFRPSHNLVNIPVFASIRLNVCRLPPWRSRKRRSQLEAKHVNTQLRSWCPVHRGP